MGRIALAEGKEFGAKSHFQAALAESVYIGAPPIILESIVGIGELFAYEGEQDRASELARLALVHPASRAENRALAGQLLGQQEPGAVDIALDSRDSRWAIEALESTANELLIELVTVDEITSSQPLLDPLSERELELLRLVAAGKSNREIALELTLALGTVKSHLHNIFQKLDVSSRTQAVVRANELDLL